LRCIEIKEINYVYMTITIHIGASVTETNDEQISSILGLFVN